jgi:hypothetical protein
MTPYKLRKAIEESLRFLSAARDARDRLDREPYRQRCKQFAAARRASMDLTRALAELRKS